jgi:hypothetical protein
MPAPTPMPAFAPMLRPEAGVGEDVPFGTEAAVVVEDETKVDETEETLVDIVGTNDDELEDVPSGTEAAVVEDETKEDETKVDETKEGETKESETKVDETEETLVNVVGTNDDELKDDDTFDVMTNPRLCKMPSTKPLPVPVCPLGSWI